MIIMQVNRRLVIRFEREKHSFSLSASMENKHLILSFGEGILGIPHRFYIKETYAEETKTETIPQLVDSGIAMYRLYNPNSGEHFYTSNTYERDNLKSVGWNYEGIAWYAPHTGSPVYRLYNPNAGEHHYTLNSYEKDSLVAQGWKYEGVAWYSGGSVPMYRAYNPNAKTGTHHYTKDTNELNNIVAHGWRNEGFSWYALK